MKPNIIQLVGPDGEIFSEDRLDTMLENLNKQPTELYPKGLTLHIGGSKFTVEKSQYFKDEKSLLVSLV